MQREKSWKMRVGKYKFSVCRKINQGNHGRESNRLWNLWNHPSSHHECYRPSSQCSGGGKCPSIHHQWLPDKIRIEEGLARILFDCLKPWGIQSTKKSKWELFRESWLLRTAPCMDAGRCQAGKLRLLPKWNVVAKGDPRSKGVRRLKRMNLSKRLI